MDAEKKEKKSNGQHWLSTIVAMTAFAGILVLTGSIWINAVFSAGLYCLLAGFKTVPHQERWTIEILGKFRESYGVLGPGLIWVFPWDFVMRVSGKVPIWEFSLPIFLSRSDIDFKGGGTMEVVKGFVRVKLSEIDKKSSSEEEREAVKGAVYGVDDYKTETIKEVQVIVRGFFNTHTIPEVLGETEATEKSALKDIWHVIGENIKKEKKEKKEKEDNEMTLLEKKLKVWRIKVVSITIEEYKFSKEVIDARREIYEQERKKQAAPYRAQQRAKETVGAVMEMLQEQTGIKAESLKKEMEKDPKAFYAKYEEALSKAYDLVHRELAAESGCFFDLRTANGFLDLAAVWQGISSGGIPLGGKNKQGGGKKRKYKEEDDDEYEYEKELSSEEKEARMNSQIKDIQQKKKPKS